MIDGSLINFSVQVDRVRVLKEDVIEDGYICLGPYLKLLFSRGFSLETKTR